MLSTMCTQDLNDPGAAGCGGPQHSNRSADDDDGDEKVEDGDYDDDEAPSKRANTPC